MLTNFPMNISPLKSLVFRKILRRNFAYQEFCDRKWTIVPGETCTSPPAIYFEDDLARVATIDVGATTYEYELSRAKGGRQEHGATLGYVLRNIELIDGVLYRGAMQHRLVRLPRRLTGPGVRDIVDSGALACTQCGGIYFGHWMSDDLSLYLAAEAHGTPIVVERKSYFHEPAYCGLMNILPHHKSRTRFNQLIVLDDVGQNSFKRKRYRELRTRLSKSFGSTRNRYVYIRRGVVRGSAGRSLTNSEQLEEFLKGQGFVIVDPDHQSAKEITESIGGARLIVGVEGSHMAHALYSIGDGGGICMLQPPNHFINVFKDYTDCLDLRYGFTTGVEAPGGFTVKVEHLERILEKMDQVC